MADLTTSPSVSTPSSSSSPSPSSTPLHTSAVPYFNPEDSALISALHELSKKSPKLVRSTLFNVALKDDHEEGEGNQESAGKAKSVEVRSWKMNEFKYYDIPSPFPTLARGLFTRELSDRQLGIRKDPSSEPEKPVKVDDRDFWKQKKFQIVVRGYDKFFNIGEVPWTTWASLEAHTAGPYTLSLKSNGCIIFIAALTPTQLLVTSKHSLGGNENAALSHAVAGERWLKKYIEGKGKTEKDMAKELWERNLTAIAESLIVLNFHSFYAHTNTYIVYLSCFLVEKSRIYPPSFTPNRSSWSYDIVAAISPRRSRYLNIQQLCDDSFEEHVLPYPPEKTGLHLHGLNLHSKHFATLPTPIVDEFAERWGFIKTATKVCDSIAEVKSFTDQCAEKGEWNGEAVEGFVVRCIVRDVPTSSSSAAYSSKDAPSRSPYAPNSSFFFKIKFDEPYMMYRDWREVTKTLLSQHSKNPSTKLAPSMVAKNKMRRKETVEYVQWVIREIERDPRQFEGFTRGHGIIRTRERFLREFEGGGGVVRGVTDKEDGVKEGGEEGERKDVRWVVVPVAIPGCGKTAVSVALTHLFGWGHTQSDDVSAKKSAPVFLKNVLKLLGEHKVVVADKNNHLIQHRTQLREATRHLYPPVRLVALNWSLSHLPRTTTHRICSDRILNRGSNHQTLTADTSMKKSHEEVLWMFLNKGEDLSESEVDRVVEMEVEESLEESVNRAVEGLKKVMKLSDEEVPGDEEIKRACEEKDKGKVKVKDKGGVGPRYFALMPELDVRKVLDERLNRTDVDEGVRLAYLKMKGDKRIADVPHITLVHSKSRNAGVDEERMWTLAKGVCGLDGVKERPPMLYGRVGRVVWDGRVMALVVDEVGVKKEGVRVERRESAVEGTEEGGEEEAAEYVEVPTTHGKEFVDGMPESIKRRLHVTVGTKDGSINPFEAKAVVEELRAREERELREAAGQGEVDGKGDGESEAKDGEVKEGEKKRKIWIYEIGDEGEGVEFRARVKGSSVFLVLLVDLPVLDVLIECAYCERETIGGSLILCDDERFRDLAPLGFRLPRSTATRDDGKAQCKCVGGIAVFLEYKVARFKFDLFNHHSHISDPPTLSNLNTMATTIDPKYFKATSETTPLGTTLSIHLITVFTVVDAATMPLAVFNHLKEQVATHRPNVVSLLVDHPSIPNNTVVDYQRDKYIVQTIKNIFAVIQHLPVQEISVVYHNHLTQDFPGNNMDFLGRAIGQGILNMVNKPIEQSLRNLTLNYVTWDANEVACVSASEALTRQIITHPNTLFPALKCHDNFVMVKTHNAQYKLTDNVRFFAGMLDILRVKRPSMIVRGHISKEVVGI
ncbi:RNA ligase-domain-containing protein [Panaeolus papilionaceus]|nr:RNA ligase-domain-containing protein [Panaeolus papilionaceus]